MGLTVEFFKKYGKCIYMTKTCRDPYFAKFPPIICKDDTFISAQAGENYHCYPKENLDTFEYETVELNRNEVTDAERLLSPFICNYDKYVYDNVPVEVVDEIIKRHGGLDYEKVEAFITKANN